MPLPVSVPAPLSGDDIVTDADEPIGWRFRSTSEPSLPVLSRPGSTPASPPRTPARSPPRGSLPSSPPRDADGAPLPPPAAAPGGPYASPPAPSMVRVDADSPAAPLTAPPAVPRSGGSDLLQLRGAC